MVLRRDVLLQGQSLAWLAVKVLAVCSAGYGVVPPEQTPTSKFWNEKICDIMERLRENSIALGSAVSSQDKVT